MTQESSNVRPRVWTTSFVILILISLAGTGAVDALQAGLPIFVEAIGRSKATSGALVTVFALAGVLPFLLSGALADRFSCRSVLIGGGAFFLAGTLGPLFWSGIGPLFFFRVLQGIGFAGLNVASAAGASNILPRERLGEGLGYYGLGQSVAIALGPALGLILVAQSPANPRLMWQILSALAAFCLLASAICACDPPKESRSCNQTDAVKRTGSRPSGFQGLMGLFIEKGAIIPSIMILIYGVGVCSTIVFVGLFSETRAFGSASAFFIISSLAMLATRFGSSLFMDKSPPICILIPAALMSALSLIMLAYAGSRATLLLAGVPFGLGFGVVVPLLSSVAVKRSPRTRTGVANSTYYLCLNLGFGFGAFVGGKTIDAFGFRRAFLLWLVSIAVPVVIGLIFMRDGLGKDSA